MNQFTTDLAEQYRELKKAFSTLDRIKRAGYNYTRVENLYCEDEIAIELFRTYVNEVAKATSQLVSSIDAIEKLIVDLEDVEGK